MHQLERPGATINFEVWGEGSAGPWAALVNGHTRPLNDFRLMGRSLVDRGLRVVALDNRGAGKTAHSRPFTLAEMADDVAAVLAAVGAERANLLGISMGGFIAQCVAQQRPKLVARLALVSTAAKQRMIHLDERPWTTDPAAVGAKLAPYFTADFAKRNEMLVRSMAKQIAKAVADGDYQARADAQRAAVSGFDGVPALSAIGVPALVVHGEDDQIIPVAASEELAGGIQGAQWEVMPGAGHLLLAERPKELYALIGAFFEKA